MKSIFFAKRNFKEILRDPISIAFCIGLPVVLLLLMGTIQKNVPVEIFKLNVFTPGIALFSFGFITLFAGTLISKDRSSSFLMRLFSSPLKPKEYIIGYSLPLVLAALIQVVICFIVAIIMGLSFNINIIYTILVLMPISILFIGFGILLGSLLNDKQVPGVASILIQVVALSSGMWFDLNLIGGALKTICNLMPFAHALNIIQAVLNNNPVVFSDILWVLAYTIVIVILAIVVFKKQMKK